MPLDEKLFEGMGLIPPVELTGEDFRRPDVLPSYTQKIKTPCGNFYLTVSIGLFQGRVRMVELFAATGSLEREGALCSGGLLMTCKLISKMLQRGVGHEQLATDVKGVPCARTSPDGFLTCPIAIWLTLRDFPQEMIEKALFKKEVKLEACDFAKRQEVTQEET